MSVRTSRPSPLFTLDEVAEYLVVSKRTVERWISKRELASIGIGNTVRISQQDLEKFMDAHKRESIQKRRGR